MPVVHVSATAALALMVSCSACAPAPAMGEQPRIQTYSQFLNWSRGSVTGERAILTNVDVLIWPGESVLVFPGSDSIYDRCYRVAISEGDLARLRKLPSEQRENMTVVVQTSSGELGSGVCSPAGAPPIRALQLHRLGES